MQLSGGTWLKRTARMPTLQRAREAALLPRELARDRRRVAAGSPVPPDRVKHKMIEAAARSAGSRVIVETGTYYGDTAAYFAVRRYDVHSIELSPELTELARQRFKYRNNVQIHMGDSGEILGQVIAGIDVPICFWLDGHYSGGVTAGDSMRPPILREIEAIGRHPVRSHVIVIDDMNAFDGIDYPAVDAVVDAAHRNGFNESSLESNLLVLRSLPVAQHR
ncbi:MAG: hypothetical protein U0990_02620 [Candidatus Nanopelagicales bacterium]|nr:hypothetical protein [Candidatus Nanopelagicales bacterium]MDZ4248965.1 hypothetical protein [Candidatus Nanopelagicales bacterium]